MLPIFLVYHTHSLLKILKIIVITNQGIHIQSAFKNQEILWADIKAIRLLGKESWWFQSVEATTLFLHSGEKVVIINALYRNMPLLKTTLNTVKRKYLRGEIFNVENLLYHKLQPIKVNLSDGEFDEYKGDSFFSLNGFTLLMFLGIALWGLIILVVEKQTNGVFLIIFSFLFGGLAAYQLNYFLLGKDYLVVKNHIWIPYAKTYALADIEEVVFDSVGESSDGLRIITKDFVSTFYPAGSLRDKAWQKLAKELRKRKIKIRSKFF